MLRRTLNCLHPYNILLLRNVRYTGTSKLPVQTFATQKDDATKTSPQTRIKNREKLDEFRTTSGIKIKERESCETYVQGHRI